jgi:hypothetical protein
VHSLCVFDIFTASQNNHSYTCLCSIANEQEHYRGGSSAAQIASSNIDDRTMHEVGFISILPLLAHLMYAQQVYKILPRIPPDHSHFPL